MFCHKLCTVTKQTNKNLQKYKYYHPFSSHHLAVYMRTCNAESQKKVIIERRLECFSGISRVGTY